MVPDALWALWDVVEGMGGDAAAFWEQWRAGVAVSVGAPGESLSPSLDMSIGHAAEGGGEGIG